MFEFIALYTIVAVTVAKSLNNDVLTLGKNITTASETSEFIDFKEHIFEPSSNVSNPPTLLANAELIQSDTEKRKKPDADKTKILFFDRFAAQFTRTTQPPIVVLVVINSTLTINSGAIQNVSNITAIRME